MTRFPMTLFITAAIISSAHLLNAACTDDSTTILDICREGTFTGYGLYLQTAGMISGYSKCSCDVTTGEDFSQVAFFPGVSSSNIKCKDYTVDIITGSNSASIFKWDCSGLKFSPLNIIPSSPWTVAVTKIGGQSVDPGHCVIVSGSKPITVTCGKGRGPGVTRETPSPTSPAVIQTTKNKSEIPTSKSDISTTKQQVVGTTPKQQVIGTTPKQQVIDTTPKQQMVGTTPKHQVVGTTPKQQVIGTTPKHQVVDTTSKNVIGNTGIATRETDGPMVTRGPTVVTTTSVSPAQQKDDSKVDVFQVRVVVGTSVGIAILLLLLVVIVCRERRKGEKKKEVKNQHLVTSSVVKQIPKQPELFVIPEKNPEMFQDTSFKPKKPTHLIDNDLYEAVIPRTERLYPTHKYITQVEVRPAGMENTYLRPRSSRNASHRPGRSRSSSLKDRPFSHVTNAVSSLGSLYVDVDFSNIKKDKGPISVTRTQSGSGYLGAP